MQKSKDSAKRYPEVGSESSCPSKDVCFSQVGNLMGAASTAALIQNAAQTNTLKAKYRATDDLIDSLHTTLKQQALAKSFPAEHQTVGSVLSGARSSQIGRTPYTRSGRLDKHTRKAKRTDRGQISQSISRIEKLISLSDDLGIEMSRSERYISEARGALGHNKTVSAKRHVAKADRDIREAIVKKLPSVMRELNSSFKELERVGASTGSSKQLAEQAKVVLRKGNHEDALRLLRDAKRAVQDSQKRVILRIMADSQGEFVKAKKAGLNIDEAVYLANRSRDMLRQGDFKEAVRSAKESTRIVDSLLEKHSEARYPLLECMKAVKLAEALGADSGELGEMLGEARRYFKLNDLERSTECSRKLIEVAKASAYGRAAESYELAERALLLAKGAGVEAADAQQKLDEAREYLQKDELAKSTSMSSASMLESNSALVQKLADKMRDIAEFSRGIEGEVESLSEVREAIASSKDRNLENLKKYTKLAEEIVGQAYESAAAYTRVSQDIVKEAYQNSMAANPLGDLGKKEPSADMSTNPAVSIEDKRQRIVNMYMAGKITEPQQDRLLLMIDSSVAKDNLV